MKLGVLVSLTDACGLDKKFSDLKKYGFESCQLCSWDPKAWTDENAAAVREMSEKHGITVSAFWCGWEGPARWNFYDGPLTLGLVPEEYRYVRMKNLCDGADFAKKFGVTDVVTHMGFIPENPNDPAYAPLCAAIKSVAEHLESNGQYLLFETGQETPVTLLRAIEDIGMDNVGINLDTANLILYGKARTTDAIDIFGKYVKDTHLKDGLFPTCGRELGEECRLGDGLADVPACVAKLDAIGYAGTYIIEREISGDKQIADIVHARDLLRSLA